MSYHVNRVMPRYVMLGCVVLRHVMSCHVMSHVSCQMSNVRCHMSHVTCHMSYVTCHMSHVTCHMSHATCPMSYVLSRVLCHDAYHVLHSTRRIAEETLA